MFDTMLARDIRQTLDALRQSAERLLADGRYASEANVFTPIVESYFTSDDLLLRVILPGVAAKDLNLTADNGRLVIEGERKRPAGWPDSLPTRLTYGRFQATIPLPSGLDLENVACHLHDGVLDVHVPLAEGIKPRQIPIQSGEVLSIHAGA